MQRSREDPSNISLDMPITQTGSLSAGERQLVAMARAILRRSNVVILDEATSQIDTDLDDQVRFSYDPRIEVPRCNTCCLCRYNARFAKSSRAQ